MKYYVDTDKSGNVTGLFRVKQRPDQLQMDESDARVTAYREAKSARLAAAVDIAARIAKLEADMTAVKSEAVK